MCVAKIKLLNNRLKLNAENWNPSLYLIVLHKSIIFAVFTDIFNMFRFL